MKVRVRKHAFYDTWTVETKNWWNFRWQHFQDFGGRLGGREQAFSTAYHLMHPDITEMKP